MDKGSFLFLLILVGMAALAAYQALFQLPAAIAFVRFLGLGGFMVLCVALMLGPLAVLSPQVFAPLLAHRRAVGISSFVLVLAHFLLAFSIELSGSLAILLSQLPTQLAAAALVIMAVLTLTSTDWAVKNVPKWKTIQRGAYVVFVLSFAHFLLQANGLFIRTQGGGVFLNLAEAAMIALGAATVALQLAGSYTVRKRLAAAKAAQQAQAAQAAAAGSEQKERKEEATQDKPSV